MTEDFRLYHDLVAELNARDIPFLSLSFSRKIPENVGVIVTSPAEADRVQRPHVVAAGDLGTAIARALQVLQGKTRWDEVLVGIDPGAEPGVAVVGDGHVLATYHAPSPEGVAGIRRQALVTLPSLHRRGRNRHGDRTYQKPTTKTLARDDLTTLIRVER